MNETKKKHRDCPCSHGDDGWCSWCAWHQQQTNVLLAIGEAVATVARAQLIARANLGISIRFDRGRLDAHYVHHPGRWLIFWDDRDDPEEIASQHPADRSADVVARLLEEASR